MASDLQSLKTRYNDSCRRQGVLPNKAVLSAIFKAEVRKSRHDECILVVFLDDLKDSDIHPLLDLFMEIDASVVDAVDVLHRSSCVLHGDFVLLLLHAINQKLRVVDLQDLSFGKDFLRDLSQKGLTCHVLNLMSSRFRKLNMIGKFMQLHTLNLDFSVSLTSFQRDCFSCMPKLKCLSLCETRVANLWTASAALVKLSSLVELRFQKCLSCIDTGPSSASLDATAFESSDLGYLDSGIYIEASPFEGEEIINQLLNEEEIDMGNCISSHEVQSPAEESSDFSQVDISHDCQTFSLMELSPDIVTGWNELFDPRNEVPFQTRSLHEGFLPNSSSSRRISYVAPKKYISYHPSPICYEKFYREYMIASLPNLQVLDNLPINKSERDIAHAVYLEHFEYLPYKRKDKESVVSILQNREINANYTCVHPRQKKSSHSNGKSQYFYSRSLSAAKVGSSARPFLHRLSNLGYISRDDQRSFRPRQFEYHPSDSRLMVFGTLDGEVVVVNHESEKIVSYIPSLGAMNSVLGLCWLKKYPSKLIAGSDNGSLRLYDIQSMHSTAASIYCSAGSVTFDEFNQLTSVHANSTDELFVASGYSNDVALYDISTGRRLQVFSDMHREHINVVKFANHSSSIFATSSFDQDVKMWDLRQKPIQPCYTASSSRGNVMVCFSPDDHYLLVSAVDNEVKQLLAVDGRLHLDLSIASTGSSQNYTRSYYLNGRDYIISGSCDEHVVRICCAQTGRRLRDVSLEGKGSGASMFVQSLRGDPFRDFSMSILAAYMRPSSNSEIVKVNLLASSDCDKECSRSRHSHSLSSMGG